MFEDVNHLKEMVRGDVNYDGMVQTERVSVRLNELSINEVIYVFNGVVVSDNIKGILFHIFKVV